MASHEESASLVGPKKVKLSAELSCWTRTGLELIRPNRLLSWECAERISRIIEFRSVSLLLMRAAAPTESWRQHTRSKGFKFIFTELCDDVDTEIERGKGHGLIGPLTPITCRSCDSHLYSAVKPSRPIIEVCKGLQALTKCLICAN